MSDLLVNSHGASLKDAGRLTFAAAKMGAEVIPGLLESIRKATSERREYGKGKKSFRSRNWICVKSVAPRESALAEA